MSEGNKNCVYCGKTSEDVPLIQFEFKGNRYSICPGHLPVLIHDPHKLGEKLPGAAGLSPSDHGH